MADSPQQADKHRETPPEITGWMAGEYRLGRKLGEGGFGAVYEAVHPLLKRRAAVKVLHRIAGSDSDAVLRFVAEARAVNQIRNRHIIDIFSFGKLPDGRHFYVMDLLEGEPLDRYIAREGRCSVANTVQLLRPIAEALDAAHAAGIVHRDLKPQNIYLVWGDNAAATPKLLDFGMAKLLGESPVHTVSGTPLGTPLYMSPEQARGDLVDGRSDVYALGVLCHELLTGHLPISGENTIGVLMAHIIAAPARVSEVCPELPVELDEPVLRMLEKKPEARPASATEALAELSRAAARAGIVVAEAQPQLSRPPPSLSSVENSLASHSADTLLQSVVPSSPGFLSGREGEAQLARARSKRSRWPLWGLLVALGALGTWGVSRVMNRGPRAAPSTGTAAQPPARASALVPVVSAAPTAPSASASRSAPSAEPTREAPAQKPKKHAGAAASARIPSDLESPF